MDFLGSCVTLLQNNWTSSNTDNITPTIDDITNVKRITKDSVLVYESSNIPSPNATGTSTRQRKVTITVSIRTFKSRSRLNKLRDEVERIFESNQTDPFNTGDHDLICDVVDEIDRSEGNVKFWRYDVKVEFWNISETI